MTEDEAEKAILNGEPWTLEKARHILCGRPFHRDDLSRAADITLGVDAATVTVHREGREVANFDINLMTWSDADLAFWKATGKLPLRPSRRPDLRVIDGGKA